MQEQHPLYYFIALILRKRFDRFRSEFMHSHEEEGYDSYDEKNEAFEKIITENGLPVPVSSSFLLYLERTINSEVDKALSISHSVIHKQNSQAEKENVTRELIKQVDVIIKSLEEYPEAAKYRIIKKRLLDIKGELNILHGANTSFIKPGLEEVIYGDYVEQFGWIETELNRKGYLNAQYKWSKDKKLFCEYLVAIRNRKYVKPSVTDLKLRRFFEKRYGEPENSLAEMFKPYKQKLLKYADGIEFNFISPPEK